MPKLSEIPGLVDRFGGYALVALAFLVLVWKLIPADTRARIERAFPRLVGGARFLAAVAPDVIGAARIGWYQVLQGIPRASVQPPAAPAPFAHPRPVDPVTARDPALTQTMQGVGPEAGDRGVRGFASLEALVALAVGLGLALACPWGHLGAIVGAVASVFTLALFAYVLPRRRTFARRGKRWLKLTLGLAPLAFALAGCPPKYAREACGRSAVFACMRDQPHQCIGTTTPGWMPIGDEPCSASGQHCELRDGEPLCVAGLAADGGAQ